MAVAALAAAIARIPALAAPPPLSGDHRLLLQFVEDGALVQKGWFEIRGEGDRSGGGSDLRGEALAALRYGRDVEAGVRLGALRRSRRSGERLYGTMPDGDLRTEGLESATVYGKCRLLRSPFDLSLGGTLTVPLADRASGRTSGALTGSGFVAFRGRLPRGAALVAHVGVEASGDARFGAGARALHPAVAGAGGLVPLSRIWTLLAEVDYEGALYEGAHDRALGLLGIDWRPTGNLVVRGGAAARLDGEAADQEGILSVAFHF